jgi:hypothetical protein
LKRLALALALLLSSFAAASAPAGDDDISPAYRKKIVDFMEVIGMKNMTRQVSLSIAKQLAIGLKQSQPDIDQKAFDVVLAVADEEFAAKSDALLAKIVPVYAKHFTEKELDELLEFYRSPIGRKTTETMPTLMQESMELAANEAQASIPKIKDRVTEELREKGMIKDKGAASP